MKKLTLMFFLAMMPLLAGAEYYSCTGEDGERYFSDTPCETVSILEQNLDKEIKRARDARIEELKVSITKTKRELMDTESAYQASLTGRTPEERAILKDNFEQKSEDLRSQLSELEARRADLVEQTFAEHAEESP